MFSSSAAILSGKRSVMIRGFTPVVAPAADTQGATPTPAPPVAVAAALESDADEATLRASIRRALLNQELENTVGEH
jgi:hypothetical protein